MSRVKLFHIITICVLISIAASSPCAAQNPPGGRYRDLNCFMKDYSGIDKIGASDAALIINTYASGITDDEKKSNLEKSEKLYLKYESEIKKLIGEFDKIMAGKVPAYDQAKADSARITDKTVEFNYCRNLSKLLKAVSNYLLIKGRYEESLKLVLINFKFGQIIAAGDGEPVSLIMHMIGIAVKNVALSGPETHIAFAKADLSGARCDELSKELERMDREEISFSDVMKSEQTMLKNFIKNGLFTPGGTGIFSMDPAAMKMADNLSARQKADIEKLTLEKLDSIEAETNTLLLKYAGQPYLASLEAAKIGEEIAGNTKPSLFRSLFNKPEAVSNLIIGICFPNFTRAYEQHLASRYKTDGLKFLCRVLKNFRETGKWPGSITDIEKICETSLSRDLFSKTDEPLIFTGDKTRVILYSRGIDYNDDQGDAHKDIILLEIRP